MAKGSRGGKRGAEKISGSAIYVPGHDAEKHRYVQAWAKSLPAGPELSGSDKQISWAERIRGDIRSDMIRSASRLPNELTEFATKAAEDIVQSETSAKFWIDNRDRGGEQLIQMRAQDKPEKFKKYVDFYTESLKKK